MGYYIRKSIPSLKKIIVVPVALSIICHVLLISATGLVNMHLSGPKKDPTITVNLSRAEKGTKKIPGKNKTAPRVVVPRPAAAGEDSDDGTEGENEKTLFIDTEDEKYAGYLAKIRNAIERIWAYPRQAFEQGKEGVNTVKFSLEKSGALATITIVKTSGYEVLDRETVRAVQISAPFAPFPDTMDFSKLNIIATFRYSIHD